MDDLIQELRAYDPHDVTARALMLKAAAELEKKDLFARAARAHLDAKREQVEAELRRVREENDRLRWQNASYASATTSTAVYRHSEVIWLRTRATDSQIGAMLEQRDLAVAARDKAEAERDEALEALADMVNQHCQGVLDGTYHDQGLSANEDAIAVLVERGRMEPEGPFFVWARRRDGGVG